MDKEIIDLFLKAFFNSGTMQIVFTERIPTEMMASPVDDEGWFTWKPIPGTIPLRVYNDLEKSHRIKLPESFIAWHQAYYFPDGDMSLVRLPHSLPSEPLAELAELLDFDSLVDNGFVPFANDGADIGLWVFDARKEIEGNEFPVTFYDYEHGLGDIIFSSFPKALECLTFYLEHLNSSSEGDIIREFIRIDPHGAGNSGLDFWIAMSNSLD